MHTQDYSQDFHNEPETSYLNCAYHGAIPHVAVRALNEAAALKQAPYRLADVAHFEFPNVYRATLASLLGGDARQIVIGDSATHGVMLLVQGLRWRSGDEVVISNAEFPANRFPWQSLEECGVTVHQVAMNGPDWLENIQQAITRRTRVVALSWVSYSTGFRLDLQAVSALCRAQGVKLLIDASQGAGTVAPS
jgi:selenocysteine lyase/cysteine desulfurase